MIEFTLLDGYTQLRDIVKAHGYDLAVRRGALPAPEEVGADWYDTVYQPGVEAAQRAGLPELYASWTRPTRTSSCGSTSCAATSARTTPRSTSTRPPPTPASSTSAAGASARTCATAAGRCRRATRRRDDPRPRRRPGGMEPTRTRPALLAGALAGVAGLLVFLAVHHVWIRPIWFILPPGLLIAAPAGLAVGWAYAELRGALPARPWTHLAVLGGVGAILAPAVLLAELRPALFDAATGDLAPGVSVAEVAVRFGLELLLTATLAGAVAGRLLGGTRRATAATALAGFVFALGPGHNVPLLGAMPGAGTGTVLLLAIAAVSAVVLVEGEARLSAAGST